jgi:hypothetical protein
MRDSPREVEGQGGEESPVFNVIVLFRARSGLMK